MRILELDLKAYGPFTNVHLDLSSPDKGFHIIYGPNEAGKSSALRAITALFFGIPQQTADDFIHSYNKLTIGAKILNSAVSDRIFSFYRIKGTKSTLIDKNSKTINEALLKEHINNISEEIFTTMFCLGYEELVEGSRDILSAKGDVGKSLFAASLGGVHLNDIIQSLEKEAKELYLLAGKNQLINKSIEEYKNAKKQYEERSVAPRQWHCHKEALTLAETQKQTLSNELIRLDSEKHRLERIKNAYPVILRLNDLRKQAENYKDAKKTLPADFKDKRLEAQRTLENQQSNYDAAMIRVKSLEQKISAIPDDNAVLTHVGDIETLMQKLSVYKKTAAELPEMLNQQIAVSERIRQIKETLLNEYKILKPEDIRINNKQKAQINELGKEQKAIIEALTQLEKQGTTTKAKLDRETLRLSEMPKPRDMSKLTIALKEAQKLGKIETELMNLTIELKTLQTHADGDLKRLTLFNGTLNELENLPIPTIDVIESFAQQFDKLEKSRQRIIEKLDENKEETFNKDKSLKKLTSKGDVLSEKDLHAARSDRDNKWKSLRSYIYTAQHTHSESPDLDNTVKLYEVSVKLSDNISDRLRTEEKRILEYTNLISDIESLNNKRTAYKEDLAVIENDMSSARQKWFAAWSGIKPHYNPNEMRTWLSKQESLINQAKEIKTKTIKIEELTNRINRHKENLNNELKIHGNVQSLDLIESLENLIERSGQLIENSEEAKKTRLDCEREIERLYEELADVNSKLDAQKERSINWNNNWKTAVSALNLTSERTSNDAADVIDNIQELSNALDKLNTLDRDIEIRQKEKEQFETQTKELADRLDAELLNLNLINIPYQLKTRLDKAKENTITRNNLAKSLEEERENLKVTDSNIKKASTKLSSLCKEAGCATEAELPEIEELSYTKRQIEENTKTAEEKLLLLSGSSGSLEEFIKEALAENIDALEGKISSLEKEISDKKIEAEAVSETIGSEKKQLEQMDGSSLAVEAANKAQEHLSSINENMGQYIRLRLAGAVLKREIERYRAQNQDPILKRASELFSRLTDGSFLSLDTNYNEKQEAEIVGIRPLGNRLIGNRLTVSEMSDGTRDQLYLSLRLASLHKYMQKNGAMPLIVDDILINFDNDRAATALAVLGEFSKATQIIFFTHHQHIADLAKTIKQSVVHIHKLDSKQGKMF
ncbi:hypothetical protein MCHI_000554 [Candidatus Magnetoovum chiemensis]|nr:hypothetical protein MCHI_000554 [Candidatus Magnetoovum chiemensis]